MLPFLGFGKSGCLDLFCGWWWAESGWGWGWGKGRLGEGGGQGEREEEVGGHMADGL